MGGDGVLKSHNASDEREGLALFKIFKQVRTALVDEDFQAAKILADKSYEVSKAAVSHAIRMQAGKRLIKKAKLLQAQALKLHAEVQVRIADYVDELANAGLITTNGQRTTDPATCSKISLGDLGFSSSRIHEFRKLRDAEKQSPGIVNARIDLAVSKGVNPTLSLLRRLPNKGKFYRADNVEKLQLNTVRLMGQKDLRNLSFYQLCLLRDTLQRDLTLIESAVAHGVACDENMRVGDLLGDAFFDGLRGRR